MPLSAKKGCLHHQPKTASRKHGNSCRASHALTASSPWSRRHLRRSASRKGSAARCEQTKRISPRPCAARRAAHGRPGRALPARLRCRGAAERGAAGRGRGARVRGAVLGRDGQRHPRRLPRAAVVPVQPGQPRHERQLRVPRLREHRLPLLRPDAEALHGRRHVVDAAGHVRHGVRRAVAVHGPGRRPRELLAQTRGRQRHGDGQVLPRAPLRRHGARRRRREHGPPRAGLLRRRDPGQRLARPRPARGVGRVRGRRRGEPDRRPTFLRDAHLRAPGDDQPHAVLERRERAEGAGPRHGHVGRRDADVDARALPLSVLRGPAGAPRRARARARVGPGVGLLPRLLPERHHPRGGALGDADAGQRRGRVRVQPARAHQGSKRERNSQLQRLVSRPFSTRFG